jgi:hypothetical protein
MYALVLRFSATDRLTICKPSARQAFDATPKLWPIRQADNEQARAGEEARGTMNIIANSAAVMTTVLGIVGLLTIGLGIYWLFNKQARLRDLAELRKKLDGLKPSDPEYSAARALYTSMVIDADRWGFFHSDSGSDGNSGSAHHSGGDHIGDHSGGGGDHH